MKDSNDTLLTNSIVSRKFQSRYAAICIAGANFKHLISSKFGMCATFAARPLRPSREIASLLYHIRMIVLKCTKKQMSRIDAGSIITMVTDKHSIRNRAIMKHPRDAVCPLGLAFSAAHADIPIASCAQTTSPKPTGVRFLNLLPKSNLKRFAKIGLMQPYKAHRLPFYMTKSRVGLFGDWGRLAAATFTEFWGWIMRGMILHVDTFLSRFGQSQDVCASLAISMEFYQSIIAQMGGIPKRQWQGGDAWH